MECANRQTARKNPSAEKNAQAITASAGQDAFATKIVKYAYLLVDLPVVPECARLCTCKVMFMYMTCTLYITIANIVALPCIGARRMYQHTDLVKNKVHT